MTTAQLPPTFLNDDNVESFLNNPTVKQKEQPSLAMGEDIHYLNKLATFSDDDDSACSFDADEDDKLLTPPMTVTPGSEIQKPCITIDNTVQKQERLEEKNNKSESIDWEFWSKVISDYERFTQSELKLLSFQVQHGIPAALRGTIWPLLTRKSDLELQDLYIDLLKQDSVYEKAITRDLHRTFPHHSFFQTSEGQEALFNVVKAYSIYDSEVGYCQGLSFVAGPLLLHMPEEEAFFVLVQLMHKYKLRGHYTPQLDLLRQRLFQFDGLLQDHLPHIHRHFDEQGVRSNMYASQWFLTLFAYKFPLDVVFRIYDIFFIEGVNCLFRIGLALLSKNQSIILSLDFDNLVTYLKDDMLSIYNENITGLLSESFNIKIAERRLNRLAKEYQVQTAKADTEALQLASLRKKNRVLSESFQRVKAENEHLKKEHALVAEELLQKKLELVSVRDENEALKQQVKELQKMLEVIPSQIESQMQADMDTLCVKNRTLNEQNAQLQDQLADIEKLAIEMKIKYAHSEIEREALKQKLNDLKRWMKNV